jgi:hypothetical protein
VSAGLFDRARALAGGDARLARLVEGEHTRALVAGGDAGELAARGNAAAAVEIYAAQGQWERAHELVRGLARGDERVAQVGCANRVFEIGGGMTRVGRGGGHRQGLVEMAMQGIPKHTGQLSHRSGPTAGVGTKSKARFRKWVGARPTHHWLSFGGGGHAAGRVTAP